MASRVDDRVKRSCFNGWQRRLQSERERVWRAHLARDQVLRRSCLVSWQSRLHVCLELNERAISWHRARHGTKQVLLSNAWIAWTDGVRKRRHLRSKEQRWKLRLERRVWSEWRDAYAQAKLQREEVETLALRRRVILRASCARWKARCSCLPMLHARRQQRLRQILAYWQYQTYMAQQLRKAHGFALSTVGRDAWHAWYSKAKHRHDSRWISYVFRCLGGRERPKKL